MHIKFPKWPSPHRLKPALRYLARKSGYELVGEGESWNELLGYRLFTRKLPEIINNRSKDPYRSAFSVPITSITSRVGFSYTKGGWHPFVETLKEYQKNPDLRYEDSTLARLYDQYCPQNMQEVLLDHMEAPQNPLCNWPPRYEFITLVWVLNAYNSILAQEYSENKIKTDGWILFGPHTEEYGRKEFQRLVDVYNSIKNSGYQQKLTDADSVNGYFLKKGANVRFVLLQGNHRVSALKVLGYPEVKVLIRRSHPAVIDYNHLYKWTKEGGGIYSFTLAEKIFNSLFNGSGFQKAQRFGLIK